MDRTDELIDLAKTFADKYRLRYSDVVDFVKEITLIYGDIVIQKTKKHISQLNQQPQPTTTNKG